jgi:hypothetical protein
MYQKTACGEVLCYRPASLKAYEGQDFCLRITLDQAPLDDCFFVYLPEYWEAWSIQELFSFYFERVSVSALEELQQRLDCQYDPDLPKRYSLLRSLFEKVSIGESRVSFYVNHGSVLELSQTIREHLGTSIWESGEHQDKILDLVLEFRPRVQREQVFRFLSESQVEALYTFFRENLLLYSLDRGFLILESSSVLPELWRKILETLLDRNLLIQSASVYRITDQGFRYIASVNYRIEGLEKLHFLCHTHFDEDGRPYFQKPQGSDYRIPVYFLLFEPFLVYQLLFLVSLVQGGWDSLSLFEESQTSENFFLEKFSDLAFVPELTGQQKEFFLHVLEKCLRSEVSVRGVR